MKTNKHTRTHTYPYKQKQSLKKKTCKAPKEHRKTLVKCIREAKKIPILHTHIHTHTLKQIRTKHNTTKRDKVTVIEPDQKKKRENENQTHEHMKWDEEYRNKKSFEGINEYDDIKIKEKNNENHQRSKTTNAFKRMKLNGFGSHDIAWHGMA